MIRTLLLIAAVGFVLSVVCLAGALAVAGGPFSIDDDWRFHRTVWSDTSVERLPPRSTVT